jgi:hypothetical protein
MPNKLSLELPDVQETVIRELDVLTDAFVSTFNQIGKIIKAFSEEVSALIEEFKEENNWKLNDKKSFDISYMPFLGDYSYNKFFSIELLKQYFEVAGQKNLTKEVSIEGKKKKLNNLYFSWSFKYDIEDPDSTQFFYVSINDNIKNSSVLSKNEYLSLLAKIKKSCVIEEEHFYELEHPDNGDSESIFIWLDYKKYSNKVSEFFQICKDELIEPFLSKIKD